MKEKIKIAIYAIGGFSLLVLGIIFIYLNSLDYSNYGNIVIIGNNTVGFILSEDKEYFNSRPYKEVIYKDNQGVWQTKRIPSALIHPFTVTTNTPPTIEK